jgi:hypothetical protein
MSFSYTPTPTAMRPNPAAASGFGGPVSLPPPRGVPVPLPPPQHRDSQKSRYGLLVAAAIAAVVAVFIAGVAGVYVGSTLTSKTVAPKEAANASMPPAVATTPTAGQIHAETADLCSRFVSGYKAMPSPQNTGFDIIPTINYIADALRDNPLADNAIRQAVGVSLTGLRGHAMLLSREADHGAIQNPTDWTLDAAAHADQRIWDLCKAYAG